MQTENDNYGLNLLKKGQKGILHAVFSRFGLLLLLLVVQFLILFGVFWRFKEFLPHFYGGTVLFSIVMVVYLSGFDGNFTVSLGTGLAALLFS